MQNDIMHSGDTIDISKLKILFNASLLEPTKNN